MISEWPLPYTQPPRSRCRPLSGRLARRRKTAGPAPGRPLTSLGAWLKTGNRSCRRLAGLAGRRRSCALLRATWPGPQDALVLQLGNLGGGQAELGEDLRVVLTGQRRRAPDRRRCAAEADRRRDHPVAAGHWMVGYGQRAD